jgi:hypothetical protein
LEVPIGQHLPFETWSPMGQHRLSAGSAQKNLGGKKKAVVQHTFPQIEEPTGHMISTVSLTCATTLPTSRSIERRMMLVMVGVVDPWYGGLL